MRRITSEPAPCDHNDWDETQEHHRNRHHLGPQTLHRAIFDCRPQVAHVSHLPGSLALVVSEFQIEHHEHAGFSIHAEQCNQSHPDAHAHVVAQKIEQPDCAYSGEWHREKDNESLRKRSGVEVQQQHNDQERDWNHDLQTFSRARWRYSYWPLQTS